MVYTSKNNKDLSVGFKKPPTNTIETKTPAAESLLTPRFYTTDFEEMGNLNITSNTLEIEAIIEEFRNDYNQHHFVRDQEFVESWNHLDESVKILMIEFLERSCTAEFSGFLLYKELSRNLKLTNPLLSEGFAFMSRDEARHAGFLNKSMSDFNVTLDLGFLTKSRKYTFFAPKFIFYATYLSEKIGYWRYITIYRHLEKHPEYRIYPIFRFFESWCQDENRHGDFFAAILKSQPELLTTYIAKLWCRFFLLVVFATMYLNDLQRASFYANLGLDAKKFDKHVIKKTNSNSARLFPVILNVENPKFFKYLDKCAEANLSALTIEEKKQENNHPFHIILFTAKQIWYYLLICINLTRLFLLKPIDSEKDWGTIY
uniref:Magnesium-protoporphyrin IX monomethyl ester [oxidative] cyclase n=1 Tax=Dictyopteris divaricata TaxID=156996 RepID=A0A2I4Q2D0_9PHAE|nr:phytochrome-regulated protein [Dictyopteris divaricata]YP_010205287.1 phytochrome-regulated protein [Grateloupia livida]AQZ24998.1 phytochrome-regulated protein [Dictyopteris divaricata]UAV85856.1 phytochrome-regulated protein [Grateloupia livida]